MHRLLLPALVLVLAACHQEKTPEAAVATVRAATVEEVRPDSPERYSATISPVSQIDLGFKSAGVIEDLGLAHSAAPSVISASSAPGFSTMAIGTGTWPDCA